MLKEHLCMCLTRPAVASVSVLKNYDVLVFFEKLYEAQQQKARKRAKARLALRSSFLSDKIKQLFFVYVHDAQLKAQKAVLHISNGCE